MESSSFTLTLSGNSSILEAYYFPPIELPLNKKNVLGLIQLSTFNSIPNIDSNNNRIVVGSEDIILPTGSYEISDIEDYIKKSISVKGVTFPLKPNNNTLKSVIHCNRIIDLGVKNSINNILGFPKHLLDANVIHTSNSSVKIFKINTLRVECNITTGAYINNKSVHTIHEFFPLVPAGYWIVEIPKSVNYLPVNVRSINYYLNRY